MRFKFCGDDDCPDWLLVQVNNLSKLSNIKLKLLLQTIIKNILTGDIQFDKVQKFTADAKLNDGEIKGCVAALTFIISNSVKFNVNVHHLNNEMQQIGFPKEHAQVISDITRDNQSQLVNHYTSQILRINKLHHFKCTRINAQFVKLTLNNSVQTYNLILNEKQYCLFLQELKIIQNKIDEMNE